MTHFYCSKARAEMMRRINRLATTKWSKLEADFEDENTRESLLVLGLGTGTSGKSTVTEHQLIELTDAEKSRFAKRIPTAKCEFTTRYNDDSGGSSRSAWVADVDGHSVFYFGKPKEEPEEEE